MNVVTPEELRDYGHTLPHNFSLFTILVFYFILGAKLFFELNHFWVGPGRRR